MYTETPGISAEYFDDLPPCLEGGFAHVPKKDRRTKTSPRMIRAVYICRSEEQPGYHRVVPYEDDGQVINVLPTILTNQWVRHEGVYPWRREPGAGPKAADDKQDPEELIEAINEYRAEEPEPDYEVEEILSKGMNDDGVMVYEVKWRGYGDEHNSWLSLDDLANATAEVDEFEAGCAAGVTEYTWEQFNCAGAEDEAEAAKVREENAMMQANFNSDTPRLVRLTDEELKGVSEYDKKKALWLRYAFTKKRPTIEDAESGKDGARKCRIVCKDLKVIRKLPKVQTYSPTPSADAFRLLLASVDTETEEVCTIDFTTAYLQADGWKRSEWLLVRLKCPRTGEITWYWMTGPIYGLQTGGHDCQWYTTGRKYLTEVMGFAEGKNVPSTYAIDTSGLSNDERAATTAEQIGDTTDPADRPLTLSYTKQIRLSMHVDDPMIIFKKSPEGQQAKAWFFKMVNKRFTVKEVHELTPTTPIDYCSLRIQLLQSGDLTLDNEVYVDKILEAAGMTDCNVSKGPLSKDLLKIAAEEQKQGILLDAEGKALHEKYVGEFVWLASTTHAPIATTVSILGSFNGKPTPTSLKMCKNMLRYLKGTRQRRLVKKAGNKEGLVVWTDSDHAGLWAVTGNTLSRMGILITYNGFPVSWKSASIKATCQSSGEAEVYALSEAIRLALHMKFVGEELTISMPVQPTIQCDASAAIGFADCVEGVGRMKHIDLRSCWVQQMRSDETIKLKCDGTANKADHFTKILPLNAFKTEEEGLMPMYGLALD